MADHLRRSYIFNFCVVIIATFLNINIINNNKLVIAEILVEPKWNSSSKCSVDTTQQINLRGNAEETCILQVISSNGTHIQIKMVGKTDSHIERTPSNLYIEREGNINTCLNKHVVFQEQTETCNSIIIDTNIQVILQSNVSLFIREVPAIETLSKCHKQKEYLSTSNNVSHVSDCTNVREYKEAVSCIMLSEYECRVKIPPNCGAILGPRECIYKECNYSVSETHTALMMYHVQIEVLDLSDNNIVKISNHAFEYLRNVYDLDLRRNNLSTLSADALWGLVNLKNLRLDSNKITGLHSESFIYLTNLKKLTLSDNMLNKLRKHDLHSLVNLAHLYLHGNQIKTLHARVFQGLSKLKILKLINNILSALPDGIFQGLTKLETLLLNYNNISYLSAGLFADLSKLKEVRVSNNLLSRLPVGLFQNSSEMQLLAIAGNKIAHLPTGLLTGLQSLQVLFGPRNMIKTLGGGLFHGLTSLELIDLAFNKLTSLPHDIFKGLINLRYLFLGNNQLLHVDDNIFKGLTNLFQLILENSRLTQLDDDIFKDNIKMSYLSLTGNSLNKIPNMKYLVHLDIFSLAGNTLLSIDKTSFEALPNNSILLVSQQEVCACYAPDHVKCSSQSERSPYLTCNRLLSDRALLVVMWLIGLGALSGNLFVLMSRNKETHKKRVNSILLLNLAASDLLMGIYMLTIACADIYFGDNFPMLSNTWRTGITCKVVGAMSIVSSEASVFFVTVISIDRFIAIKFPYSTRKLGKYSVKVVATVVWTISLALGIVPSVLSGYKFKSFDSFKFYDNSHVCIGLPLALTKGYFYLIRAHNYQVQIGESQSYRRNYKTYTTHFRGLQNGLYFSTALFLGVNCVCYLIILACYIEIVKAVRESSKRSGRSQEMTEQIRLTMKVTTIVATDFFCWFPIILLGILVQVRVIELPASVFAWCVTFVLPINSAINPYLYTIAEVISDYKKNKTKQNKN